MINLNFFPIPDPKSEIRNRKTRNTQPATRNPQRVYMNMIMQICRKGNNMLNESLVNLFNQLLPPGYNSD